MKKSKEGNPGSPQGGYIVSLMDEEGLICPIMWKSHLIKRKVQSTMEAETTSLIEVIEGGILIKQLWKELVGEDLKIVVMSDSKTLVDGIYSTSKVKSLMWH